MAIWNLGRFVQTLVEFEVVPWLPKLWGGTATGMIDQFGGEPSMGLILVVGGDRPENLALVTALSNKGYRVQRSAAATANLVGAAMLICCEDVAPEALGQLLAAARQDSEWRSPSWELFNFREPSPALAAVWGAVDDVVMGGISQSRLQLGADAAYFTGNVSTENNGGFASVRTRTLTQPWDLSRYEGFRLQVKGDGKRYKFIARCEDRWDGVGYSFSFETIADQWITVDIPFAELIPVFRAKSVPEMGKFKPNQVYAMQVMLSKFEYDGQLNPAFSAGNFALGIAAIAVYGGEPYPQIIAISRTTTAQESLQESNLPYCLLHCPDGFTEALIPNVVSTIGDRQTVNQILTCRAT